MGGNSYSVSVLEEQRGCSFNLVTSLTITEKHPVRKWKLETEYSKASGEPANGTDAVLTHDFMCVCLLDWLEPRGAERRRGDAVRCCGAK